MKLAAIILNILLAIPFLRFAVLAVEHYNDFKLYSDFGLGDGGESRFDWPHIAEALGFLIAFKICVFLNIRKKYRISAAVSGGALAVFLLLLIFK
jgi:hypothetical protein